MHDLRLRYQNRKKINIHNYGDDIGDNQTVKRNHDDNKQFKHSANLVAQKTKRKITKNLFSLTGNNSKCITYFC